MLSCKKILKMFLPLKNREKKFALKSCYPLKVRLVVHPRQFHPNSFAVRDAFGLGDGARADVVPASVGAKAVHGAREAGGFGAGGGIFGRGLFGAGEVASNPGKR